MKTLFLLLSFFLLNDAPIWAATGERRIDFSDMPQSAQTFITQYFPNDRIAEIRYDSDTFDKTYEVKFSNGTTIDFNLKGDWTDIECTRATVPSEIIPVKIRSDIEQRYPKQVIRGIERSQKGYEIELSNGHEVKYDSRMTPIR
ncbi:MAG: PepSY-like domain-containing protein [Rikenellaceae bacterium]|nr:PepSY-like domain-containing protein [Rikenellaceae bacterium]